MWVQNPINAPNGFKGGIIDELFKLKLDKIAKKLEHQAKNIHLPVLNRVEHLYTVGNCKVDNGDGIVSEKPSMEGIEVSSPAVVLPAANASTVADRWMSWSVLLPRGPGKTMQPTT